MVFMCLHGIACTYCCVICNFTEIVCICCTMSSKKEMVGLLCTVLIIFLKEQKNMKSSPVDRF